jgi:hypothetical protein
VLDEHEGYVVATANGGWTTVVYTVAPGVPGDSGSAVVLGDGRALGDMVTLILAPYPAGNGVSNLAMALDYARQAAGVEVELKTWSLLEPGLLP